MIDRKRNDSEYNNVKAIRDSFNQSSSILCILKFNIVIF